MSRIRGRDTKPEMLVRRGLHGRGLRFRVHDRRLPGTPDLVFGPRRAVIFVHGCFWHGHDCPLGVRPRSNAGFWAEKIERNRSRDTEAVAKLVGLNWRVATVWECALRGRLRLPVEVVLDGLVSFLAGPESVMQIAGDAPAAEKSYAPRDQSSAGSEP
jgi:DNA mismatch endonuclease (patch repair protein)